MAEKLVTSPFGHFCLLSCSSAKRQRVQGEMKIKSVHLPPRLLVNNNSKRFVNSVGKDYN